MDIDDVVKGLITGILVGFLVIYSLRPQVPYPEWVLKTYEHPWIFTILISMVVILAAWDARAGGVMLLIVATLLMDYYFLGTRIIQSKQHAPFFEFDREALASSAQSSNQQFSFDQAYPIFNNDVDFQPGHPSPF